MIHVSRRVTKGEGVGAEGNTHETLCGLFVVETSGPGPYVDWAGWRADCPVCLTTSAPAWRPWVEQVFKMAQREEDAYAAAKKAYAKAQRDAWPEFLASLKAAGGSTDMQTSKTGRYPYLHHFVRGEELVDVEIYAYVKGGMLRSPLRDWRTEDAMLADYRALAGSGGRFNDTEDVCKLP